MRLPDRRSVLTGALAAAASPARAAAPRRIVSLNACVDVMLVRLADRSQILALSRYAREPQTSIIAAEARALPSTWGGAEEVVALRPDLVLDGSFSGAGTRGALDRLGVRAERFGVPQSVAESLAQVRRLAGLVGHPDRGEALAARIGAALAASRPPAGSRPIRALAYQPNGFSPGPGTLVDEMMRIAGFDNVARGYGLTSWGNVSLEQVLADPPEVLLVGERSPGARSWADRVMTHPALRSLGGRIFQASLPEKLVYCGGPVLIETAAVLSRARRDAMAARA